MTDKMVSYVYVFSFLMIFGVLRVGNSSWTVTIYR